MDEIKKIVATIKKQHKGKKSADTVLAISGRERVGKSMLGLQILELYDSNAVIEQVSMNLKDFIKSIYNAKDVDGIVMDEAGDGLFARDWNKEENKDVNKLFFVIGAKRFLTILIMPDFFALDKGFRERRVKGLFYVWKTGRVKFYDEWGIKRILREGYFKRTIPCIYDWYPDYYGHLREPYNKLKIDKVHESISDLYEKYSRDKKDTISLNKFKDMYHTSPDMMYKAAKLVNYEIPKNLTQNRCLIDKTGQAKLIEGLKLLNEQKK